MGKKFKGTTVADCFSNDELFMIYDVCREACVSGLVDPDEMFDSACRIDRSLRRAAALAFIECGCFTEDLVRGFSFMIPAFRDFVDHCRYVMVYKKKCYVVVYGPFDKEEVITYKLA